MKFRFAASAAVALASLALPTMLSADDGLKYEDLIHCAATNLVIAQVLGLGDDAAKNKGDIDKYQGHAASLMAIASVGSKKDTDTVMADTKSEQDTIIGILGDKSKSDGFIGTEVPKCKTMGEAADSVVAEDKKAK